MSIDEFQIAPDTHLRSAHCCTKGSTATPENRDLSDAGVPAVSQPPSYSPMSGLANNQLPRRRSCPHAPPGLDRSDWTVERLSEYAGLSGRCKTLPGMAQNFLACDRGQLLLLPPSLTDGCRRITWCGRCWARSSRWIWRGSEAAYRLGAAGRRRMTRR